MNFERPQSEPELEVVLQAAYGLVLKSQDADALALCDWLIEEPGTMMAGHRQRSAVLEYMGHLQNAISDLEFVTSQGSQEPADFHALGILYFKSLDMVKAETAFTQALHLSDAAGNSYYENSCRIFRAEARLKLKNCKEALTDAKELPGRYSTYLPGIGMRSKEQIIAEAHHLNLGD